MARLSERSIRLRDILKRRLDQQNMTYSALAVRIGVSLPTIKRWMTKDDFPIEGLDSILKEIDLSWQDLINAVDKNEVERMPLNENVEHYISTHPRENFVSLLLAVGYRFQDIQKELDISAEDLEALMFNLDRNNIIVYNGRESIRLLMRIPIRVREDGEFSRTYFGPAARLIFEEIISKHKGFTNFFRPEKSMIRLGEMYLSAKSVARLKADMWELIEKYRETSRIEMSFKQRDEVFPITYLTVVDRFNLWRKTMWEGGDQP
jgi:transcriptional regulator with XRE-family HTH domain